VIAAESFLDLANCPDILDLAPKIGCPVLFMRGDKELRELYPAEEFARRAQGPCEVEIVPDCGHFYVGREDEIAGRVTRWLGRVLKRG
jgi:pimeloyl-ACP methyl ester carboxylesterase